MFDGAIPYVLVYKKFVGSTLSVVVRLRYSNPWPTFLGLGIISSSASEDTPEPNNNSTRLSSRSLDVNLLAVLFNFNI